MNFATYGDLMPSKYYEAFQTGLINYSISASRPGLSGTTDTGLPGRIIGNQDKKDIPKEASALLHMLRTSNTEDTTKSDIAQFLAANYKNQHDLSAYIVDALSEAHPTEHWTQFRPPSE